MARAYNFIVTPLDNGFKVTEVDGNYKDNHLIRYIDDEDHKLIYAHQWNYAESWYWNPLGDWYIEADTIEDGVRMAMHCNAGFICDEGRYSNYAIALFQALHDQIFNLYNSEK